MDHASGRRPEHLQHGSVSPIEQAPGAADKVSVKNLSNRFLLCKHIWLTILGA